MEKNKDIKKKKKKNTKKRRKPTYEVAVIAIAIPEESLTDILQDMSKPNQHEN